MQWTVEFLNATVMAEFDALPIDMQASLARIAKMIQENGPSRVGMPYVRHLQGKLWEMRGNGRGGISRNIYAALTGRRVVILRAFVKKEQKTNPAEIKIAMKRLNEVA